ncbi:hypothetical protein J4214_02160 [Candidatus Woesearchaeota archaeon]|nr:hypothetical protein [Candidatus Woesearchaeota archaeon]
MVDKKKLAFGISGLSATFIVIGYGIKFLINGGTFFAMLTFIGVLVGGILAVKEIIEAGRDY